MSAPLDEEVVAPSAPPRALLSGWVTVACTLVVAALVATFILARSQSPLDRLDHPEASLERLVTRDMDLRDALARVSVAERAIYSVFAGFDDSPEEAIGWYEELLAGSPAPAPPADLYRVILLAEAGQTDRARPDIAAWQSDTDPRRSAQGHWAAAAYDGSPPDPETGRTLVAEIRETLPASWFADTLAFRIAERIGDAALASQARSAIAARGESLLWRWRALATAELGLVLVGVAALLSLRPLPFGRRLGEATLPPPWPLWAGYGLFIRGALGFLAVGWLPAVLVPDRQEVVVAVAFVAGVPMLIVVVRYVRARSVSILTTLGLGLSPGARVGLARVTLALVALDFAGGAIIAAASAALGVRSHWADGFPEELLWDPWGLVGAETLDTVLWTPFVEELAFRGILFASLHCRLPVWPSALLSAAVFAGAHGYGATGAASVLWSGLIWALAYQRTRSLWPAILAHGMNNLIVNVTYLWLLRL